MQMGGCGTALVTPFSQDGAVDENALRNLVAWQVESGIDFLIPCGTTGETPTLSHDEWLRVIDVTIEVAAGHVPIMAGAPFHSTQRAAEQQRANGGSLRCSTGNVPRLFWRRCGYLGAHWTRWRGHCFRGVQ